MLKFFGSLDIKLDGCGFQSANEDEYLFFELSIMSKAWVKRGNQIKYCNPKPIYPDPQTWEIMFAPLEDREGKVVLANHPSIFLHFLHSNKPLHIIDVFQPYFDVIPEMPYTTVLCLQIKLSLLIPLAEFEIIFGDYFGYEYIKRVQFQRPNKILIVHTGKLQKVVKAMQYVNNRLNLAIGNVLENFKSDND